MPIANGVFKLVRYKRQAANSYGAPAASGAGAYSLPRVQSTLDLQKETYGSNAIRQDMQKADFRHGTRSVGGSISDELKAGAHEDFFETIVRQAWQTAPTTTAIVTVAAATTTGNMGTFTRSAGSFITDGFKLGQVGRWSGWATTGVNNNGKNMMVIGLTPTVMTVMTLDGSAVAAKAAGDSVTFTVKGKQTWIPQTNHTNDLYTFEHYYSDLNESEIFDSCRLASMNLNLPSNGMATIETTVLGRDMAVQSQSGSYFTSPTALAMSQALAAVNGIVVVNGMAVAVLTGLTLSINANATTGQVVGSNVSPDVFMGTIDVTGNLTAYFTDVTLRDIFRNETEASLMCAFTADNTPSADFVAFTLPRLKAGGATKDDGQKGLVITMPFTALLGSGNSGGQTNNAIASTLAVQDSTVL
jgi:hypothetical protein